MSALRSLVLWLRRTFDLLDCVLGTALTLVTTGAYLLWGAGWACLVLGGLLLLLLVLGLPAQKTS